MEYEYTLEHVHTIFGFFWVIYECDGYVEREVFSTRDFKEAKEVLHELRGE